MLEHAEVAEEARRLRVLVLASTFPRWRGDTEPPFVFNLSRGLAERFDVTVLAPHAPRAALREEMDGVDVVRYRYFWPPHAERLAYGGMLPNLKRNPWLWLEVPALLGTQLCAALRVVREQDIDVIHAHWVVPQGIVAALLGMITRKPVVVTAHGGDVYGVPANALKRWVLRHCARVTAVSSDLGAAIERLGGRQADVDVISMGVDAKTFRPSARSQHLRAELAPDGPLLLFVGRLAEKKGVGYLLDAMPAILAQHPTARLVIVGDGPLRGELEERVHELEPGACVVFEGAKQQDELPAYYATADVFIAPSIVAAGDREGLPVSLMEAMASGCAVVASDVGGIGELVTDGETGLLVAQRDSGAIADAVSSLLNDGQLRSHLARKAMRRVRREFDQAVVTARYARVLEEAAA